MEEKKLPEGYIIPVHKSLTEAMLIGGVPRDLFILNITFGFAIGLMMRMYPFFILTIIFHILFVKIAKKDPRFWDCTKRHINSSHFFDV